MHPKIGIIGCGKISAAYLKTLTTLGQPYLSVAACADLNVEAAKARATEFGIPRVLTVEQLLADPEIQLVANLTIPEAHETVNRAALAAGKHVYTEKPLALDLAAALDLRDFANKRGLMLSCAPDTLLGVAHQRARHLLDSGAIGELGTAFAHLQMGAAKTPRYMRAASGPLLDMGPYYVGALVFLLGPVRRVSALGARSPLTDNNQTFVPEAPSRLVAALEFASGLVGQLSLHSFGYPYRPRLEIFGHDVLTCADPNMFGGPVLVNGAAPTNEFPDFAFPDKNRGAGLIEMALALREKRDCRLNANFSAHCLEILLATLESLDTGRAVTLQTTCERPAPMPPLPAAPANA